MKSCDWVVCEGGPWVTCERCGEVFTVDYDTPWPRERARISAFVRTHYYSCRDVEAGSPGGESASFAGGGDE